MFATLSVFRISFETPNFETQYRGQYHNGSKFFPYDMSFYLTSTDHFKYSFL